MVDLRIIEELLWEWTIQMKVRSHKGQTLISQKPISKLQKKQGKSNNSRRKKNRDSNILRRNNKKLTWKGIKMKSKWLNLNGRHLNRRRLPNRNTIRSYRMMRSSEKWTKEFASKWLMRSEYSNDTRGSLFYACVLRLVAVQYVRWCPLVNTWKEEKVRWLWENPAATTWQTRVDLCISSNSNNRPRHNLNTTCPTSCNLFPLPKPTR